MNRYPAYKPSGIEWIGEIPEHWDIKKLKHVSKINPQKEDLIIQKLFNEDIVFLPMEKVHEDGSFEDDLVKPTNTLLNGFTYFKRNDVIFAKITPCFENGKGTYLNTLKSDIGFGSTEFHVIRTIEEQLLSSFFYYITRTHWFKCLGEASMIGSAGQKRVPSRFIQNLFIALPPPPEQTAIANFLDRKTAEIDQIIDDKEKLIELYEEEKKALINEAVTKGIDPNVKMKDSGVEWLGEIPEHWEVKKLKYVSDIVLGKMLTPNDKGGYNLKPYLRAQNLRWFKPDISIIKEMWFSENELAIFKVSKGDLLVSEGGEVGRTCIWNDEIEECYIQNSVNKVRIVHGDPTYFLYQFFNFGSKDVFNSIVNKVSIAHLTREKLKEIAFVCPPIDEQNRIVHYVNEKSESINTNIAINQKEIDLLKEYRQALIFEAVTGKIDVRRKVDSI